MCGITGFIAKGVQSKAILAKMNDSIAHRGRDAQGIFIEKYNKDYTVGLAHRRLAILDLSANGQQPMSSQNNDITIIFNGEIYNFQQIKEQLKKLNYSFQSNTDTEVIIKAYQEWGIQCIEQFNGMFAIAIYDKNTKDLFLIRDRLGVKPLYYFYNNKNIIFSSELKPLMLHPAFIKKIDKHALSLFLYHGYITAPHSIFENTYKLEPGNILNFNNGNIKINSYWSLKDKIIERQISQKTAKQLVTELDTLLNESIKDRMVSDVPLGVFLSGGIDSSLIAAIMQKNSKQPIKTFTIGLQEEEYNEAIYAKKVAEHLGTEHHEYYLSTQQAQSIIQDIAKFYDEPFADSSQIPTMLVSQMAQKKVTVCLSGDGGDELFCGYGRYDSILQLQKLIIYAKIANKIPFCKKLVKIFTKNFKFALFFKITNIERAIIANYLAFNDKYKLIKNYKNTIDKRYLDITHYTNNIQEKYMFSDIMTYLPDDILTKVDRATMSCSLEGRAPIVDDHRILEFSLNVPHNFKYKDGNKKYLLKKLLMQYLPQSLINRPKQGFGIPIYQWLRKDLSYLLDKYLDEQLIIKQNIFDVQVVSQLKKVFWNYKGSKFLPTKLLKKLKIHKDGNVDKTIWYLIIFQMWYCEYMTDNKN